MYSSWTKNLALIKLWYFFRFYFANKVVASSAPEWNFLYLLLVLLFNYFLLFIINFLIIYRRFFFTQKYVQDFVYSNFGCLFYSKSILNINWQKSSHQKNKEVRENERGRQICACPLWWYYAYIIYLSMYNCFINLSSSMRMKYEE